MLYLFIRDFKRSVVLAVAHPCISFFLFAVPRRFSQRPSCHLAFFPLSSSLSCCFILTMPLTHRALLGLVLRRRCRSLALAASLASQRNSALCSSYFGLSSLAQARKDHSSDSDSDHLPPSHVVAQIHSRFEHLYSTVGAGTGVPFGYIMTADELVPPSPWKLFPGVT